MIRLGVIGYGNRIHGMIDRNFRAVDPDLRVTAVVDPDEEGVRQRLAPCDREATFYKDVPSLLRQSRIDALAIGTRCNLHTRYAIQAAAGDLPLFLEKPVAVDLRQAAALERAFAQTRCPVVVSFPLRVSPLCQLARQYVTDGAIGAPVHIAATNYVPYGTVYWEAPYRDYAVTGGLFLQKATHDLDYLMYLMGEPIVRIAAMATRGRVFGGTKKADLFCSQCDEQRTCRESPFSRKRNGTSGSQNDHRCVFGSDCGRAEDGTLNEDCSSTLLEFASGAHGVYTQVFYARRDAGRRGAIISGYDGTVDFDWFRGDLHRVRHHAPFSATEKASGEASHFGGDIELARDFCDLIEGHIQVSRTPIETGIQSAYACLAARESALKNRYVTVRQVSF
jgi:predicted dehydrogenase